ncbi:MAG: sigma 54-interacting transcriptional regulator [Candidatus Binatia bacterium]
MISPRVFSVGLPLTAAVVDLVAVVVVLAGGRDRHVARSFASLAFWMAVWTTALGIESIPDFTTGHADIVELLSSAMLILPAMGLSTAVVWSETSDRRIVRLKLLGYGIALLLCLLHFRGFVIAGFLTYSWGSVARPGPLHPLVVTFAVVCAGLGIFVCVQALKQSPDASVRIRAKYWLLGIAVFFPTVLINFLANYGLSVFPTGSIGNIVMVGILAYAAVRHRLMDIDLFIMRAAATLLASVAVVLPIAGAAIWAEHLPAGGSSALVIGCLVLAALLSLLVFSRVRAYLEQEVESALFRSRHAARKAIRQLSAELVKLPVLGDGGRHLTQTLMDGLGLQGVALYLQKKTGVYRLGCACGSIAAPKLLNRHAFEGTDGGGGEVRSGCWEACVPVRTNGAELGFIALGPKGSGAAIDDSDLALLTLVASQLAVGLKNAEYVREIRRQQAQIEELRTRLEAENVVLRSEVRAASQFGEIIGSSGALQRALALVEKVAPTNASVLVTGETGTGKELIARAIHEISPRRAGPLISVNCPAIPPELAESELFGHERGAFTGALAARPGKFELAHGGTIFLDEVADLPMRVQVKLLRVLQEHETQRVGGCQVHKLDLRVVAASNRDLEQEMRAQRFREDLYYRLAAVRVEMPALRERLEDVPMLASFFLERAARTHRRAITGFTPEALAALGRYSWPGNVRELQNVIERAVLLCTGEVIRPEYLSDLAAAGVASSSASLQASLRDEKRRRIEQALAQTGGNQAAAARLLGLSPSNLARLMKRLGTKLPTSIQ